MRRLFAVAAMATLLVVTHTVALTAQDFSVESRPPICVLTAEDEDVFSYIPRDSRTSTLQKSSANIVITFLSESMEDPWPQDARDALNYAAGIWANIVTSQIEIRIEASWTDLGSCDGSQFAIASAGPQFVWRDFPNAPKGSTWYPDAVADALNGADLGGGKTDIVAKFNRSCGPSGSSKLYFGTDGKPRSGTIDMVSVALHEFAHGLGFAGNANVDDGDPSNGTECNGTDGVGCLGGGKDNDQLSYDRFTEDGNGVPLLALSNPSVFLGIALEGGRAGGVFFSGPSVADAGFGRVQLYAPPTFNAGASYAHLDENTFNRTPDALMTPFLGRAESIHVPGDIACGILADIGWTLSGDCTQVTTATETLEDIPDRISVTGLYPNPLSDRATILISVPSDQHLWIDLFDTLGKLVRRVHNGIVPAGGTQQFELDASGIPAGAYVMTVSSNSGTTARSVVVAR
jgi:hypothetical protein